MALEVLNQIKQAETRAEQIVKETQRRAGRMITEAKSQFQVDIRATHLAADRQIKEKTEEARQEADKQIRQLKAQGETERTRLRHRAEATMEKAILFIIQHSFPSEL